MVESAQWGRHLTNEIAAFRWYYLYSPHRFSFTDIFHLIQTRELFNCASAEYEIWFL